LIGHPPDTSSVGPVDLRRQHGATVIGVALLASLLMLFLVWPSQQLVEGGGDPYNYAAIARRMLVEGFGAHGLTKREASLYPAFIAAVYYLVGERPLVVTLLQCGFFAATAFLVFDIARRLYNPRTGLIAGLLFSLDPVPLRYVADLHMETMLTLAMTLTIWTMVRLYLSPTARGGLLVGVVGGLAALTKGVALVPLLVFSAWWMFRCFAARLPEARRQIPWRPVVAIALATGLTILPWTLRNYRVTGGRFVLIGPGLSDAFLRGYVFSRSEYALLRRPPYVDAENECNAWFAEICRRAGTEFGRDEVLDEKILGAVARQKIVDEPLELVRKTAVGLLTFWYQMTTLTNSLITGGLALVAWVLAGIGLKRSCQEGRPAWLLWLPVVSMNVFIALLCSLGRYSLPIIPCLIVLAASGVDTLMRVRSAQPRPRTT
jgi:4-amino-4-deoxy-L-arabinose transferase-like glycosyltransferase